MPHYQSRFPLKILSPRVSSDSDHFIYYSIYNIRLIINFIYTYIDLLLKKLLNSYIQWVFSNNHSFRLLVFLLIKNPRQQHFLYRDSAISRHAESLIGISHLSFYALSLYRHSLSGFMINIYVEKIQLPPKHSCMRNDLNLSISPW